MSLVMELASLPKFFELAPVSDKLKKEREHEELVTRFFAYGDANGRIRLSFWGAFAGD